MTPLCVFTELDGGAYVISKTTAARIRMLVLGTRLVVPLTMQHLSDFLLFARHL